MDNVFETNLKSVLNIVIGLHPEICNGFFCRFGIKWVMPQRSDPNIFRSAKQCWMEAKKKSPMSSQKVL